MRCPRGADRPIAAATEGLRQGRLIPVPPVDKALRYLETRERRPRGASGRRAVIGSPATVRAGLEEVAGEYGAEELVIVTITHADAAGRRSYELVAAAFELESRRAAVESAAG